jgi:hypothetical protein
MSPDSGFSVWTWVVGIVSSLFVGVSSGTWAASRKVAMFEATQAQHATDILALKGVEATQIKHTADIVALKLAAEGHSTFCAKQKQDLIDAIRKEICSIVQLAISDLSLKQQSSIASLDKNVALIAQSNEQMESHIVEIFNRLNRERDTGSPTGKERRS